jgi:hypothetical protein
MLMPRRGCWRSPERPARGILTRPAAHRHGRRQAPPEVTGLSIESPEGKAIADTRRTIFRRDFLPHLQPTRGAQRLLESLRDDRKTLFVASSAEDDELEAC